jgi:hypothetical protein
VGAAVKAAKMTNAGRVRVCMMVVYATRDPATDRHRLGTD